MAQSTGTRQRYRLFAAFTDGTWRVWLTLVVCLSGTILAWYGSKVSVEKAAQAQFAFRVGEIRGAIHTRMLAYEKVLEH